MVCVVAGCVEPGLVVPQHVMPACVAPGAVDPGVVVFGVVARFSLCGDRCVRSRGSGARRSLDRRHARDDRGRRRSAADQRARADHFVVVPADRDILSFVKAEAAAVGTVDEVSAFDPDDPVDGGVLIAEREVVAPPASGPVTHMMRLAPFAWLQ